MRQPRSGSTSTFSGKERGEIRDMLAWWKKNRAAIDALLAQPPPPPPTAALTDRNGAVLTDEANAPLLPEPT
jgi:hypothetical protein